MPEIVDTTPVISSEDSILDTIKKLLGLDTGYTAFDIDITTHINSVFAILDQLGATPKGGFWISGREQTWGDYLEGRQHVEMIKSYIYLKVRQMFDPPATSFALDSIQKLITELEFRINVSELIFNPSAYGNATSGAFYWIVDDLGQFPKEAQQGDLGIDPDSGNVWRNT